MPANKLFQQRNNGRRVVTSEAAVIARRHDEATAPERHLASFSCYDCLNTPPRNSRCLGLIHNYLESQQVVHPKYPLAARQPARRQQRPGRKALARVRLVA